MPFSDYSDKEIKARAKADLTESWWKQAWPGEKPSSNHAAMIAAIKGYKAGKRDTAVSKLLASLENLRKAVSDVRKEANSTLGAVPKRKKAIQGDLDQVDIMINYQVAAAMKFGDKSKIVFERDFGKQFNEELSKLTGRKDVKVGPMPAQHELLEAVFVELDEKNAANMLNIGFNTALDNCAFKAAKEVSELLADKPYWPPQKIDPAIKDIVMRHYADMYDMFQKVPTNCLKKIRLNSDLEVTYQKELTKKRVKLAVNGVMLTTSFAAIFLPGTQGFAIYGFMRSTLGLIQQVAEHNATIADKAETLRLRLKELQTAFQSGAKRAASETGGTLVNALVGMDVVSTLGKAQGDMKDLKLHVAHSSFKVGKLDEIINKMLDGLKDFDKMHASMRDDDKAKKKLGKQIAEQRVALDKMLDKAADLSASLRDVERMLPGLDLALRSLGENSKKQVAANEIIKLLVSLGGIAAGGVADASVAFKAADMAKEAAQAISSVTIASVSLSKELYETGMSIKGAASS
jgi:hypothetical protein